MMFRIAFLLILSLAFCASAGTLTTRDGKTYSGPLQLRESQITVTTAEGPRSFPLTAVLSADFKAGGGAAPKAGHGLRGDYFVGRNLAKLQLSRIDPAIDYDWTRTLPHPSLVHTGREFSVRWAGQLRPDHTEKYSLISNTDDGVRVYLDGKLIIDRWYDQAGGDTAVEVALEKDHKYDLRVEYYNGQNDASATLSWASPSTPRQVIPSENLYLPPANKGPATTQAIRIQTPSADGGPAFERILQPDHFGLKAEYFADRELTTLNFIRFDPNVDFHFHPDNPPDPSMSPEGSIRWTGMIEPRFTEDYRFHAEVRRRIRLWIDDHVVIDEWKGEGAEYSSDKVPMVAGKKVPFKLEYTSPNGFMLCRLRWSSKSQGRDTIPAEAFSVAPDEKLGRPVVGLVYPAGDTFIASPASMAILATGLTPNGRITKLQFYDRNAPLTELDAQPFRYVWQKPPPGVYGIRAKATDSAGVTALSDMSILTVTGKGNGTLRAPWGDFYIANNDSKTPGTASQDGDQFKIENAIGTLVSESEHDAAHFVVQPLEGDGQIIARVTSVVPGPDDGIAGAMAGITIRENLKNRCKQFSMLFGQAGEEPGVNFVRRQDHSLNPVISEKTMKGPVWLKLARHGSRVYAYTSTDGKDWDLYATERFESAPQVFVGLVAFSGIASRPATAQFDHVQLVRGAPPLESSVKGFVTRGGTFVAADVFAIDENLVRYVRNNAQQSIPLNEVARILYKPLLQDHAEKLSPGRTGLLMSTGDFLEGDVRSLKEGTAAVSSVLFGLRKVATYDDLTAIILHDVAPEKTPFTVTTIDGSIYRLKSLKPDPQNLQVEDASLGRIAIPLGTLSQLQVQ
ncbi:MAG: hypothetical protein JWN40_4036 [Phycisphaerales bacterium]|nr:hypothetical protein [Phycisphaerales bacterium]